MSSRPNQAWLRSFVDGFFAISISRPPAGDIEYRAGGERALLGGEPAYERRDLLDRHEAVHGDFREHIVDVLLGHLVEDRRLRRGGRYAVDEDARLRELFPERFGE